MNRSVAIYGQAVPLAGCEAQVMEIHHVFALHLEDCLRKVEDGIAERGPYGFHLIKLNVAGGALTPEVEAHEHLLTTLIQRQERLPSVELRQIFYDINCTSAGKLTWPSEGDRLRWSKLDAKIFSTVCT